MNVKEFFDKLNKGARWDIGVSINRTNALPLDANSVFSSLVAAQNYAAGNPAEGVLNNAYPGQYIAVVNEDGTVQCYVITGEGTLEEVGGKIDLPLSLGEGENSIETLNAVAIGAESFASGNSSQAGLLGYYFSRFKAIRDAATGKWTVEVKLCKNQRKNLRQSDSSETSFELSSSSSSGSGIDADDLFNPIIPITNINYEKDDILSIVCDFKLENCIKVTNISESVIEGEWCSKESILNAKITTGDINEDEYSIYCIAKPKAGEVPLGYYAHAEGWKTQALEKASHAEGRQTIAWGQFSHAEGRQTEAGYVAHSEGYNTKAQGDCAHAEGYNTEAQGVCAHAEGYNTRANDQTAHAEGYNTRANGQAAHAEGGYTNAAGWSAHAEGGYTNAAGWFSHAEGRDTEASGFNAHSEGARTIASGYAAHAEGQDNISGSKAFTIKNLNKNTDGSGTYILDSVQGLKVGMVYSAHVYYSDKGWSTQGENYGKITGIDESTRTVTVDKLFCEYTFGTPNSYIDSDGYDNEFNTFRIITNPELGTRTIGAGTHAEGMSSKALSKGAHAEGYNTLAQGSYSHAEGQGTTAAFAAHAEGKITKASGFHSHAEGHGSTSSGDMSHAEGSRSTAAGEASHAEGTYTTAAGNMSHAEGDYTTAAASYSHAEGDHTTASGEAAHAEGFKSVAKGKYSHAEGSGTTAAGSHSHVGGSDSKASYSGSFVHGTGLNDNEENQTVIGKYNASAPGATFVVGNGTSSSNRSNAFVVYDDGSADIKNLKSMNVSSTSYDTKVKGFKIFEINSSSLPQDYRLRSYILETWAKVDQVESLLGVSAGTLPIAPNYYPINDSNFNIKDLHAIIYSNDGTMINLGKVQGFYPTTSNWTKVAVVFDYSVPQFEDFIRDKSHVLVFIERPDVGSYNNLIPQGKSVIGDENKSAALNGLVVGTGLRSYNEGELGIGTYNDSDGDNLFSIGNGTSDEDRSNVFAVKKNGTANISNKLLISSEQYDSTIHGFGIFAVPGHGVDDFIWTNNLVEYRNNTYVIQTWAMGQQVDSLFGKDIRKDATFTSHTLYELDDFGIEDLHAIVIDNKDGTTIDVGRVIGFSTNVAYNESQNRDGGADIRYSWSKLNVTFENAVPELNDFHYTEEWDATCNRYILVFVEKSDAGNSISSHNSLIVGSDNRSSSSNSACIGTGLRTYGTDEEVVVGRYNSLKSGSLFTIGNGTSDENRSNAFEVDDDGNTYINNNLYIGGTGNSTIAGDLHIDGTLTLTKDNKEVATVDQISIAKEELDAVSKRVYNLELANSTNTYIYETQRTARYTNLITIPGNTLPYAQIKTLGGGLIGINEAEVTTPNGDIINVTTDFGPSKVTKIVSYGANFADFRKLFGDRVISSSDPNTPNGSLNLYCDQDNQLVIAGKTEARPLPEFAEINVNVDKDDVITIPAGRYFGGQSFTHPSGISIELSFDLYSEDGLTKLGTLKNNYLDITQPFKILSATLKCTGEITEDYTEDYYDVKIIIPTNVFRYINKTTKPKYTPYRDPIIYEIPEEILNLDGYGFEGNYIDFDENTMVKDLKVDSLDGISFFVPNYETGTWLGVTHGLKLNFNTSSGGDGEIYIFGLQDSDESSDFEFINNNEVKIAHTLGNATITDISDIIPKDNFIEIEPYGVIYFENEHNLPISATIEYQVKVGE